MNRSGLDATNSFSSSETGVNDTSADERKDHVQPVLPARQDHHPRHHDDLLRRRPGHRQHQLIRGRRLAGGRHDEAQPTGA